MKAQFKYAIKHGLSQRGIAFAAAVSLNIVFTVLGTLGIGGDKLMITGIVFSSLSICAVFGVNIVADIAGFSGIFGTPQGYLNALTPVESWKILMARAVTYTLADTVALAVSIAGTTIMSLTYSGQLRDFSLTLNSNDSDSIFFGVSLFILGYMYIMMLCVFGMALKNSILSNLRGGLFITILCVVAAAWALNFLNMALAPFGDIAYMRPFFFHISLRMNGLAGFIFYDLIILIKITLLFLASSMLIERRINL